MHGTTAILRSASTVGNWPSCWKACGASARRSADGRIRRFKEGVGSNRPPLSWWVRCRDSDLGRPGDSRFGNSLFPQPVGGLAIIILHTQFSAYVAGSGVAKCDYSVLNCHRENRVCCRRCSNAPRYNVLLLGSWRRIIRQQPKAPNGYPFEALIEEENLHMPNSAYAKWLTEIVMEKVRRPLWIAFDRLSLCRAGAERGLRLYPRREHGQIPC